MTHDEVIARIDELVGELYNYDFSIDDVEER